MPNDPADDFLRGSLVLSRTRSGWDGMPIEHFRDLMALPRCFGFTPTLAATCVIACVS